ncbi:MAG: protein-tyrosine-phosphatase [Bacteroidetes bacterium]|nr:protein-tyrosine-phosphatase [Bacteroidota bacterium]
MFDQIRELIVGLDTSGIPDERKLLLDNLAGHVRAKLAHGRVALSFICTHNSRRSHLGQIWAQTMAAFHGLTAVDCYSGGTEATALFPKVAETLENQGFQLIQLSKAPNPVYAIRYSNDFQPVIAFSKTYDHPFNPRSGFIAVMTCDSANEACPVVFGADMRVPILYLDPKVSDGSPQMDSVYAGRSLQIAREMKYLFESVANPADRLS